MVSACKVHHGFKYLYTHIHTCNYCIAHTYMCTFKHMKIHKKHGMSANKQNTGCIFQVGVSYTFTQMSYMMYFMLSLSFTSLGETAILFQSLSHVLSFPLGGIMTRDHWLKKLQLAVSFFFFLSPHFFIPIGFDFVHL